MHAGNVEGRQQASMRLTQFTQQLARAKQHTNIYTRVADLMQKNPGWVSTSYTKTVSYAVQASFCLTVTDTNMMDGLNSLSGAAILHKVVTVMAYAVFVWETATDSHQILHSPLPLAAIYETTRCFT